MINKSILPLVALFFIYGGSCRAVVEGGKVFEAGEYIERPKRAEDAAKLEERVRENEKEYEEAKKREAELKKKLENFERKEKGSLPEKEAQEREQVLKKELAEQQAFKQTYETAQEMLKENDVQVLLKKYKDELKQAFEKRKELLKEGGIIPSLEEALQDKNIKRLREVKDVVDGLVDFNALEKEMAQKVTIEQRLEAIAKKREELAVLRDELNRVQRAARDKTVREMQDSVQSQLAQLDAVALKQNAQRSGFFTRILSQLKNWFKETFDFTKPTILKRTATDELQVMLEQKATIKPVLELIGQLNIVSEQAQAINELVERKSKEGTLNQDFVDLLQDSADLLKTSLNEFETKFTRQTVDLLGDVYNDVINLNNNLQAKMERYPDKYSTLFEKMYTVYQKELGDLYTPDKMYESLGFDISKRDPSTITFEEIEQANIQKAAEYPMQSAPWQAARNASTVLKDSTARATYDAFLKDFKALKQLDIDSKNITQSIGYLKTQGELEKLAISESTYKDIQQVMSDVLGTQTDFGPIRQPESGELPPSLKKAAEARKALEQALQQAEDALEKQQQTLPLPADIPGG